MNSRFLVTDFGDVNDGWSQATRAVQRAINNAASEGGGTVVFPRGIFRCGTLELRSNVTLELTAGAVLRASADLDDYRPVAESHGDRHPYHLIVARGCENVTIEGPGVIEGSGPDFWEKDEDPRAQIRPLRRRVSPLVEFTDCRNVRVVDLTIEQSPGWTVHLLRCENSWFRGLRIANHLRGPDTRGLVLNGCRDVWINDCAITTGDDAIALQSTRDAGPCERITISHCVLQAAGAAVAIGRESWHDLRHLVVGDCIMHHSHVGLGLYALDGAAIEDVLAHDLLVDTRGSLLQARPLAIHAHRREEGTATPAVRRVSVRNLRASTDGAVTVAASRGGVIEDVLLAGVMLHFPAVEAPARPLEPALVEERGGSPEARRAAAALVVENVRNLQVEALDVRWPSVPAPADWSPEWKRVRGTAEIVGRDVWAAHGGEPRPVVWARGATGHVRTTAPGLAGAPSIDAQDCVWS